MKDERQEHRATVELIFVWLEAVTTMLVQLGERVLSIYWLFTIRSRTLSICMH